MEMNVELLFYEQVGVEFHIVMSIIKSRLHVFA